MTASPVLPKLPRGVKILKGSHRTAANGSCALEWMIADRCRWQHLFSLSFQIEAIDPSCTSTVIANFVRTWNDSIESDADRTRLLGPLVPLLLDTAASPGIELRRAWLATDWLCRICAPAWLDLAGHSDHAKALRALPELSSDAKAISAQPVWSAALLAARSAALSAAESATPTVAELQSSAVDLIKRMCAVK